MDVIDAIWNVVDVNKMSNKPKIGCGFSIHEVTSQNSPTTEFSACDSSRTLGSTECWINSDARFGESELRALCSDTIIAS